ncbi:MAG: MarR family transcriptional regulator [Pseudomonadota bacterium]
MDQPKPIDHVGWDLFRAFAEWKTRFHDKMEDRGFAWMKEARGSLIQHIGPNGIAQAALVRKSGMTKQAVQQHVDGLVRDGIVERVADEKDARQKRVQLTAKGHQTAEIANQVKTEIDLEFAQIVGAARYATFKSALAAIIDGDGAS